MFEIRTGEKLPLTFNSQFIMHNAQLNLIINKNKCKTFNQKIQYIKLYGITDLMRDCTDKIKVRDYVKDKIGNEYLKPVLGVYNSFDEINFDELPQTFVIKCNHGCKWHCIIKDKQKFLNNKKAFKRAKEKFDGWLNQEFWCFEGFELNYKGIEHKIFIEQYLPSNRSIKIYCFNGSPKIYVDVHYGEELQACIFNEDFSYSDLRFSDEDEDFMYKFEVDDKLKQSNVIAKELSKDFEFVRVDLMVNENKLYFEELTFTPYSGFTMLDERWNKKMGEFFNNA